MKDQLIDASNIQQILRDHHQGHILRYWDRLGELEQKQLAQQIESIDFKQLGELIDGDHTETDWGAIASQAELPPAIALEDFRDGEQCEQAKQSGELAISNGQVAMILVAGGQGSRLGFDHPKGMFPIGPISERTLYQMIIEKTLARARQFDSTIPMYIMTSPPTHQESSDFLSEHLFFGYDRNDVQLFCQGTMPAIDQDGK
ncbi:MAG: UTP--glucose-1-phosphate uridylyltransferase, partial [Planctomycetota bacterium]